ncbi:hypothetical protein NC651_034865 [Populus alba x Populus x berolinensis]|nr:hypothetical protein NC651_034865 [Populus alba x Populus x berolinensis]
MGEIEVKSRKIAISGPTLRLAHDPVFTTTISSTAHDFGLPLQSSLTTARRQRSPVADPIFTPSLPHLQQQQATSGLLTSNLSAIIINGSSIFTRNSFTRLNFEGKHVNATTLVVDGGLWLSRPRHLPKDAVKQLSRAVEKRSRNSQAGVPSSNL